LLPYFECIQPNGIVIPAKAECRTTDIGAGLAPRLSGGVTEVFPLNLYHKFPILSTKIGADRNLIDQRGSIVTMMPSRGRSVVQATGSIAWPGTGRIRKRCARIASATRISLIDNAAPGHTCGPIPNGK